MKKLLLFIWIISWTTVAFQQIQITLQSLDKPSNHPPNGYVIVGNRSGQKIMITEETDEKFNPKNPETCDQNFIYTIDTRFENSIFYLSYEENPTVYGVNDLTLKVIPSGDDFYPDRGFKIHNYQTFKLSNDLVHEIPLNIFERVDSSKYYIDFILQGNGINNKENEICFTELLFSLNEDNFYDYMENKPVYVNNILDPYFEENPNILAIGEDEYIKNYVMNNKKRFTNHNLPRVNEAALVLLNKSTRYSETQDKDIWINRSSYYPSSRKEIVIGLFGDVSRHDFLTVSKLLETLQIVAPSLKITISDDINDVSLPIHITPCDNLVSERFNGCQGYAAGLYHGYHDYIWVDASIKNKDWRSHVIIHELGHALGLNHNLCIDSVMSYSDFAEELVFFNELDLMQLQLLHHLEASKYQGKSFQKWAIDYFDLDEELINSYKDDPYLACNVVQDGWKKYVEMQK